MFMASDALANLGTKALRHALPRAIITPLPQGRRDPLPGGILPWQHPPLAAGDQQIEDRIHSRSHLQGAWMPSWRGLGKQVFETIPLTLAQIAWIHLGVFHT
jgi:hypothetical protein